MNNFRPSIKIFLIAGLSLLTAAAAGGTYAYYSNHITVENRIQLGDIDISLTEYQIDKTGNEQPYGDDLLVLPGDTISKIPRITCLAEPCYIRALITHSSPTTEENSDVTNTDASQSYTDPLSVAADTSAGHAAPPPAEQTVIPALEYVDCLSDENILGLSENWVRIGNYYYYKNILLPNETVNLFQGVSIPAEWGSNHAGQQLYLNIQIDAIQSQNFTPDFSSENPWGNEEIEVCAHCGDRSSLVNPYTTMYVEFEGNSHKLVAVPDDFFSNIGTAMPGDHLSDTVILKNTTSDAAELFFHTALPENLSQEQKNLLEQIVLSISLDGKELYRGNLEAASLHSDLSLGTYPSRSTKNFDFTLTLPAELKNRYALADTVVRWVFSVRQDGATSPVKTGDTMTYLPFVFLGAGGLISAGIYLILLIRRKHTSSSKAQTSNGYKLRYTRVNKRGGTEQ
ncbi:MAG: hypothetical protein MR308_01390 [Lachnospiraceae bacterium]|nr:hypothetical protein [Lachnospiraceae bacterium]